MNKFNSAFRLHKIFTHPAIKSSQKAEVCLNVWGKVFGLSHVDQFNGSFIIGNRLMLISKEVLYIEKLGKENGLSMDYLNRSIPSIKNAISPTLLGQHWVNTQNLLSPEVLVGLEGLANMPYFDIQSEISTEDLAEIQKLINELSDLVKDSNIGGRLREFLLRQIHNINSAIAEYSICGSRLFKSSFKDSIEQNSIHDAVNTLKAKNPNIYEKFMKISKKVLVVIILSKACVSDIKEYEENLEYLYDKAHIEEILSYFDSTQEETSNPNIQNIKDIKLLRESSSHTNDPLKIDPPKEEKGENNQDPLPKPNN